MDKNTQAPENQDPNLTTSQPDVNGSSQMLKPWMKTLGKEYWQNEVLGSYDSLGDAIGGLLKRPEAKTIPDSYGCGDADEIFRKAGLTKEEAEEIEKYYSAKIPYRENRKDTFGAEFDFKDRLYAKAVDTFGKGFEEQIKASGLDRDPVFAKIMASVGKEIGSSGFTPTSKDGNPGGEIDYIKKLLEKNFGK